MGSIWCEAQVDLEELARDIAGLPGDGPIDFLLAVDAEVSDTSFTLELIDHLQKTLKGISDG